MMAALVIVVIMTVTALMTFIMMMAATALMISVMMMTAAAALNRRQDDQLTIDQVDLQIFHDVFGLIGDDHRHTIELDRSFTFLEHVQTDDRLHAAARFLNGCTQTVRTIFLDQRNEYFFCVI